MDIKSTLKENSITQEEFAEYLGMSRIGLNKSLNHGEQKKGMENNLKLMVAEKRGIKLEINL